MKQLIDKHYLEGERVLTQNWWDAQVRRHEGAEDPTNCTVYSVQEIKKKTHMNYLRKVQGLVIWKWVAANPGSYLLICQAHGVRFHWYWQMTKHSWELCNVTKTLYSVDKGHAVTSIGRTLLCGPHYPQEESHSGLTTMCTALWQRKRAQRCDSSGSDSAEITMCTLVWQR